MRLVTYLDSQGKEHIGFLAQTTPTPWIVEIQAVLEWLDAKNKSLIPRDMLELICEWKTIHPLLRQALRYFQEGKIPSNLLIPESQVQLISPIPRPVSMRDGYAFRQHVEAARRNRGVPMIPEFDHFPIYYYTNHLAVTGPGPIGVQKLALDKLDFELEAAVVLGKQGKNIPASRADEFIFGYMIMNDWSARTLQMEEMKLNLGPAKGKDFATSLGPYLITADELENFAISSASGKKHNLRMKCFVNGKQVSDGNLKDMTWSFAQILERVSYGVTVYPGEVIGSGTVGTGCFLELNGSKITDNQWLKPGDQVVLEIDQLGHLENTIIEESDAPQYSSSS
jgi:fumarylacetoacetate (FAA) hydrolase